MMKISKNRNNLQTFPKGGTFKNCFGVNDISPKDFSYVVANSIVPCKTSDNFKLFSFGLS